MPIFRYLCDVHFQCKYVMLEIFPENFKLIPCIFMEIYDLEYMSIGATLIVV